MSQYKKHFTALFYTLSLICLVGAFIEVKNTLYCSLLLLCGMLFGWQAQQIIETKKKY